MSEHNHHKQEKVAVISGGTGYVGSAIARKLASDGMAIALLYHEASVEAVSGILAKLPGSSHRAYQCDLQNAGKVAEVVERIERDMGMMSVCVHAAGTKLERKQLLVSLPEDLRNQFEVNVFGSFNFLTACARRLKDHGEGVIIGITSSAVIVPTVLRGLGAYAPAKYALHGMLVVLKDELSLYQVRVYAVAPGFMPEGVNRDIPKAFIDIAREKSPTKKLASADNVADVVSFLCSDHAVHLTNLTLLIAPESGAM